MEFNRFDICEAYYVYATEYHTGQGSAAYRLFSTFHRIGFNPGARLSADTLSENGRIILDRLIADPSTVRPR